jgi:hypothetical protein
MSEILVNQLKTAAGQSTLQFDSTGDVLLSTGRLGRVGGSTIEIDSDGQFVGTSAFTADSATALTLNRTTSDGTVVDLQKDGTTVGTIGVYDTGAGLDVYMADTVCGLRMSQAGTDNIMPCNADGSNSDNDIDLGSSTTRFKDLYLSSGAYLGGTDAANHLDDYEEGTFEIKLNVNGTDSSNSATCYYVKIGRLVFIEMLNPGANNPYFPANPSGSLGDPVRISTATGFGQLPFIPKTSGNGIMSFTRGIQSEDGDDPQGYMFAWGWVKGDTQLYIGRSSTDGNEYNIYDGNISGDTNVTLQKNNSVSNVVLSAQFCYYTDY